MLDIWNLSNVYMTHIYPDPEALWLCSFVLEAAEAVRMGLELVFQRVETQVLGRVREKADQASQDSKFKTNIDAGVLHDKL